jgi:putative restriction endonuclease
MRNKRENWSRDELIIAFNLYCRTPFGRIHRSNPQIIQVAKSIGRTTSSLGMKMCNFARFDPLLRSRNIKGLEHGSKQDETVWQEFHEDWEKLALESQKALEKLVGKTEDEYTGKISFLGPDIPTEAQRTIHVRLVQRFFRDTVLSSYNFSCAICKLNLHIMLNASHIVPWSVDRNRRADPSNGLSLCVFHDRAFDRGLITISENLKVTVSKGIKIPHASKLHRVGLLDIEGKKINLPDRFCPDPAALAYHRQNIFLH